MKTQTPSATPVAIHLTIQGRKLNPARSGEIIKDHNFYKLLQVRKALNDMPITQVIDQLLAELLIKERYKAVLKHHGLLSETENVQIIL